MPPKDLVMKDFTKEDEFIFDINHDSDKDVIAITDIQTISYLISQYEIEDDIDEDPQDIVSSTAETVTSFKT